VLPAVGALAGLLGTLAIFYPGVLPRDGVGMYNAVVNGFRVDTRPPLFVDVWRLTDVLVCGSGGIFALHVALYWSGVLALSTALASGSLARLLLVLSLGFLPPVFGRLPSVSVDNALLAAWSLGAAVLLHRDLRAHTGVRRRLLSLAACSLLAYGALMRHNAITGVVPLLWLLVTPLEASHGRARRRSWVLTLVLVLLLALGVQALNRTATRAYAWAVTPLWDLAAVSVRSGEILVPRFLMRDPSARDELQALERHYSPWSAMGLFFADGGLLEVPTDSVEARGLLTAWRAAIAAHPGEYVWHRSRVVSILLAVDGSPLDPLFLEHSAESPEMARCKGPWPVRFEASPATRAIRGALHALTRTPLYWTWLWALAAITAVAAGVRVGGVRGRFASAIAASGLCYVAPLAVIAPAAEFRYTLWLHAASAIAIVLLATAIVERRRDRRRAAETTRSSGRG
jgi:hypothetical protein